MKKTMVIGLMAAVLILTGSAVYAWWGGYEPGYGAGANVETVRKFQKETLSLRDELMVKNLELQSEYDKPVPDTARIASLKKEVIDIQAKIQVVADKHGIPAWGPGSGRGMMAGRGMMGAGCPCPMCQ